MKKILQYLVFIIIQIPFVPLAIIGVILAAYKEMVVSKKLGVSFTAGQAIQPKWYLHYFRVREDKDTVLFVRNLPIESELGFWLLLLPSIIANRLTGFSLPLFVIPEEGKENLVTFINMRIVNFDNIVEKYSSEVEQMVLMGGGYDLRFIKYTKGKNLKVFDIDQLKTLQLKLDVMKKAGIESDWITYVPIDFREESWVDKLIENGFDKTKKTYFQWESVSPFLEEKLVKDTLRKMSEISPKGSVIGQDSYSKDWIKKLAKFAEKMGEPFISGIDMSTNAEGTIRSLLDECGFELKECIFAGHKSKSGKPFYAITVAVKK